MREVCSGSVCASGRAVREAGGGVAAGARPEPIAAVPGEVDRCRTRRGKALELEGLRAERLGAGRLQTAKIRSDADDR